MCIGRPRETRRWINVGLTLNQHQHWFNVSLCQLSVVVYASGTDWPSKHAYSWTITWSQRCFNAGTPSTTLVQHLVSVAILGLLLMPGALLSKHVTLTQCCFIVGQTSGQHLNTIVLLRSGLTELMHCMPVHGWYCIRYRNWWVIYISVHRTIQAQISKCGFVVQRKKVILNTHMELRYVLNSTNLKLLSWNQPYRMRKPLRPTSSEE